MAHITLHKCLLNSTYNTLYNVKPCNLPPLEEAPAAVTAEDAVVFAGRAVAAHEAQGVPPTVIVIYVHLEERQHQINTSYISLTTVKPGM